MKNPLWYAAKYGAFKDTDDNDQPNLESEWNADNDSQKIPDAFNPVSNPAKLQTALQDILDSVIKVAKETASSTAVTTNSTRLETDSLIYQAQFNSSNWTGRLLAYSLYFDNPSNQEGSIGNLVWDTSEEFADPADRKIFTYDPSLTGSKGIQFTWSALSNTQKQLIDSDCYTATSPICTTSLIMNFLRGDNSNEVSATPPGTYRSRIAEVTSGTVNGSSCSSSSPCSQHVMLGDIINSDPWFVGNENYGYNILPDPEGSSYLTFRSGSDYAGRTKMIYIGANDGMLHGFDASNTTNGGKEIFAYVPNYVITRQTATAGISDLKLLTQPDYTHRYFVDGSPRAGDVYYGGAWHTVLAGTLGAGGKGLFALDVTDPDNFSASDVLWEISNTSSPTASNLVDSSSVAGFTNHLGFTFSQPSVVRMANGKWAVIIGNGYNSINQKAVLYIIDVETGSLIRSINTQAGSITQLNGLSTPVAVDINDDRIVDAIYAGDLLGNLWKFDVSNSNASSWDVAFKSGSTPIPLFIAKDANNVPQPITAKPQVSKNPSNTSGGVLVYFGTGRYFVEGDNIFVTQPVTPTPPATPPAVQTFYGISDNSAVVCSSGDFSGVVNSCRTKLVAQTIDQELVFGEFNIRVTSNNEVSYTGASAKKGWFMDLVTPSAAAGDVATAKGERVVATAVLRPGGTGGRIIFTTLITSDSPCDHGGTSWLMELEATTGKRLTKSFDLNGDWEIGTEDLVEIPNPAAGGGGGGGVPSTIMVAASGKQSEVGIIKTPGIIAAPGSNVEFKYTSGTKPCDTAADDCANTVRGSLEVTAEDYGANSGRQSWRQLR